MHVVSDGRSRMATCCRLVDVTILVRADCAQLSDTNEICKPIAFESCRNNTRELGQVRVVYT
jgi:hypothetical protein